MKQVGTDLVWLFDKCYRKLDDEDDFPQEKELQKSCQLRNFLELSALIPKNARREMMLTYCCTIVWSLFLQLNMFFFYFWVAIARSPVAALCTSMTGSRPGVALHRRLMTGMC